MTHGHLAHAGARARLDDLYREASARRFKRPSPLPAVWIYASPVTLRFGFPDDADALARLAALDNSRTPAQPVLLAEVEGELRAALSLSDGAVVADPFRPTTAVVELLRARARQLGGGGRRLTRLRLWRRQRERAMPGNVPVFTFGGKSEATTGIEPV